MECADVAECAIAAACGVATPSSRSDCRDEYGRGIDGGSRRDDSAELYTADVLPTAVSSIVLADGICDEVMEASSKLCAVDVFDSGIHGDVACAASGKYVVVAVLVLRGVSECVGVSVLTSACASTSKREIRRAAKGRYTGVAPCCCWAVLNVACGCESRCGNVPAISLT